MREKGDWLGVAFAVFVLLVVVGFYWYLTAL